MDGPQNLKLHIILAPTGCPKNNRMKLLIFWFAIFGQIRVMYLISVNPSNKVHGISKILASFLLSSLFRVISLLTLMSVKKDFWPDIYQTPHLHACKQTCSYLVFSVKRTQDLTSVLSTLKPCNNHIYIGELFGENILSRVKITLSSHTKRSTLLGITCLSRLSHQKIFKWNGLVLHWIL